MSKESTASELDSLIAPEIKHDLFYKTIEALGRYGPIRHVLEIGSSSGQGSTEAWVTGMRDNVLKPTLYCLEVSKVRFEALSKHWEKEGFVKCYHGSSVGPDQFPPAAKVQKFLREVDNPLRQYPEKTVLGWLEQDLEYLRREGMTEGCLGRIKKENGIEFFDAVLIDGSEFTGEAELEEVYGAEFILLDDSATYKNYANRERLLRDSHYELMVEDLKLRGGFTVFRRRRASAFDALLPEAPVCFFTMVLNGMPFIRQQLEMMKALPFSWRWHIVEGAAELKADTGWSVSGGGVLDGSFHKNGLSTDGTTEWLDQVVKEHPGKVYVHRKPSGQLWQGKTEMANEAVFSMFEEGLLWELDSDELWTVEQVTEMRRMFTEDPLATAAWFWCWFYVGTDRVVSNRYNYSQNPRQEWLRVWRFRPGMRWETHEPPVLVEKSVWAHDEWSNVAAAHAFSQDVTAQHGLVFQHYAYVTEAQLDFKARYYGYRGLSEAARKLQSESRLPCLLKDYFPWVQDGAQVDLASKFNIEPLATMNESTGDWAFSVHGALRPAPAALSERRTIVVDAVFFQLNNTGIGRVWREILEAWSRMEIGQQVVILDRNGTAPRFPRLRYRAVAPYDSTRSGEDSLMLQDVCDQLGAGVFLSTYFTAPTRTPSLLMVYDMIGEFMGAVRNSPAWFEKSLAILEAASFITISESTRQDLLRLNPWIPEEKVKVAHCGVSSSFHPATPGEVAEFRQRLGIEKEYVLIVGERVGLRGYKNAGAAFKAMQQLPAERRQRMMILCVGGMPELEQELQVLTGDVEVKLVRLTDEELRVAYAGAHVMAYPSLYEGFGMPVVEAMACGCPVITCRRASLPEAGGDAAIYIEPWDHSALAKAVLELDKADARQRHVEAGLAQAARFSYQRMAEITAQAAEETLGASAKARNARQEALWENYRRMQAERQAVDAESKREALQGKHHELERQTTERRHSKALSKAEKENAKLRKALEKAERRLAEARADKKPKWKRRLSRLFKK